MACNLIELLGSNNTLLLDPNTLAKLKLLQFDLDAGLLDYSELELLGFVIVAASKKMDFHTFIDATNALNMLIDTREQARAKRACH